MHKKKLFLMANGEEWMAHADIAFLEELEELNGGAPAFAVLGDIEDLRASRVAKITFSIMTTFRELTPIYAGLTYQAFRRGDWMPAYCSPEWDAHTLALSEFVSSCFPLAVTQGRSLLMAARECQRLGLTMLSTASSESGDAEPAPAPDTPTQTP